MAVCRLSTVLKYPKELSPFPVTALIKPLVFDPSKSLSLCCDFGDSKGVNTPRQTHLTCARKSCSPGRIVSLSSIGHRHLS